MEKKIICHVLTDRNTSGKSRWMLNYLKYYNEDMYDMYVVIPKGSDIEPLIRAQNCKVVNIHSVRDSSLKLRDIKLFRKIFKEINPDVVQTHGCFSAIVGAKTSGVKCIIETKHTLDEKPSKEVVRIAEKYINALFTSKIVVVSEAVKDSMVERGIHKGHIEKIYNGVEVVKEIPTDEKNKLKDKYNIGRTNYCVGVVSKLEPIKDLSTFLLAADKIIHIRNDVRFLIAGSGSLKEDLKDEVEVLGIEDYVVFTGYVQEIEKVINMLDIMIITSKFEALSISVIEAMSVGIPAIGTDSGGIREVIENKKTGELIDIGDFNQLADKILEFIDDRDLYEEYSCNCIKVAEEKFSAKSMAEKLEKLYENCIKVKRR